MLTFRSIPDAQNPRRASLPGRGFRGYSMSEMIWVIALMGILASIAIPQLSVGLDSTKLAIAKEKVEVLNRALAEYNHSSGEQRSDTPMASGADELIVLHDLQSRSENNPLPGSPFVQPTYRPSSSSSTADYRIVWSSNFNFKLLVPGQTGTGLKIPFDGSDIGPAWVTPPGYNPRGR